MESLIKTIRRFSETIDLNKRFTFDFEIDPKIFTEQEIKILSKSKNIFQKNLKLKEIIYAKANGDYKNTDLNFWIIHKWGKLNFQNNEKNILKIKKYSSQLSDSKLTKDNFSTISSLSKLSSFIEPEKYVIYDSRVIYSLNWLILTLNPGELKYFPMPNSRNNKLISFDLDTIINLKHKKEFEGNVEKYYNHSEAYFKYCDLIKLLTKELYYKKNEMLYLLEMLLFTIADEEIYNEVIEKTYIEINT